MRAPVDGGLEARFLTGQLRLVLARQVAQEPLAGEAPQLPRPTFHLLRRVESRQLLVALVDLLDVEGLLLSGVVEVELLVEVGDEAICAFADGVDLLAGRRLNGHPAFSIRTPVQQLTVRTERHTQVVDITAQVRSAVNGSAGSAVLVYVPHTTAGVTINENADPNVARDFEMALERIAPEGW